MTDDELSAGRRPVAYSPPGQVQWSVDYNKRGRKGMYDGMVYKYCCKVMIFMLRHKHCGYR